MSDLPELTDRQSWILSLVAEDPDALLFELEVQELTHLGLISDLGEGLRLTEMGTKVLEILGN